MPRGVRYATDAERILSRIVVDENGCWLWQGYVSRQGYGQMKVDHRHWKAHRFAYVVWRGPIAEGLEIDHLCRVRRCVNPDHLEPVTHRENVRRGDLSLANARRHLAKTHCVHGHSYGNAIVRPNGARQCRECKRQHDRRRVRR